MRFAILGMMFARATLTALPAAIDVPPMFIWNASASVPIGLYVSCRKIILGSPILSPSRHRNPSRSFLRPAIICRAAYRF